MKLIASIKAKDSSLISFMTIVIANFEFEDCGKLIRVVRTRENVCVRYQKLLTKNSFQNDWLKSCEIYGISLYLQTTEIFLISPSSLKGFLLRLDIM